AYMLLMAWLRPAAVPAARAEDLHGARDWRLLLKLLRGLAAPLLLMVVVLGSILAGVATPTEAAGVGALGALLLALASRQLSIQVLGEVARATARISSMVYLILIGATIFSLVFRGFGGDSLIEEFFLGLGGGVLTATALVMLGIFLL